MKKAIVLLLALAVLGGAVFAEDLAYTLSGSASLIWGYDLNDDSHGFTNTTEAKLDLWWVAKQASTHGEEAITGSITIKDFKAGIDDGALSTSNGTVTAKILFPSDLYLQIASAPDFSIANAAQQAVLTDDDGTYLDLAAPAITSSGGFTFGMDADLSFALMVGSTNTHSAAGNDDYMVGGEFGYAMGDMLDLGVNFLFGAFKDDPATVAVGVNVASTPIEGLDLYLGLDADLTDNGSTMIDVQFDADYELAELLSFGAGAYVALDTQATVGNPYMSALVRVGLLAVENLTFDLGVDLWNILDTADTGADMEILLGVNAAYKAMLDDANYVKPYADVYYVFEQNGVDAGTVLSVGVEAVLIPLTTFTLDFTAGEMGVDVLNYVTPMGSTGDKGVITFKTKIAY